MDQEPQRQAHEQSAPLLYTPEQAAELLQVTASWLRRRATARAIPCTFIGKHLRFSPDNLHAIIAAGATTQPHGAPANHRGVRRCAP